MDFADPRRTGPEGAPASSGSPRPSGAPRLVAGLSLGLGVVTVLAPGRVARLIGAGGSPTARTLVRAVGVRELATGIALLGTDRPRPWLLVRAAGDVVDAALLASVVVRDGGRNRRAALALGGVLAIGAGDALLATRAHDDSGRPGGRTHHSRIRTVRSAVTINRPPEDVYRAWRDFERLPEVMGHLASVESRGPERSRWTANGPLGVEVSWDAELVTDTPSLIEWRSTGGAIANDGSVRFAAAPGGRGTEVHVELRYAAPAGAFGRAAARLAGESPVQQVDDDLRRFKQVLETGHVVRSEGSPEGTLARRQATQRPARPAARTEA